MNTGRVERKKSYMDKETFKKIVDRYHKYMNKVNISHHGEALLHPDLIFFIKYLHKYGVKCVITTNATLLTKKMSKKLLEAELDYIMFSFDIFDKKIYESIRVGAKYEKTLANIKNFLKMKNDMNKNTHVSIRTINMDKTKKRMNEFFNYFKDLPGVDSIAIDEINTWGGRIDRKKFIKNQVVGIRKLPYCLQPWVSVIINSDAGVFVCNNHEDEDFGNLMKEKLEDIWNGSKYQNLRKSILKSDFSKNDICKNCDYESLRMYLEEPNSFFPFTKKYLKYLLKPLVKGSKIIKFEN
jgi:radical SAM protein with 4Fe4S-binding SPASM domain